jgi:pyruvate dehydrogenase E2 component (dihydrolipoamide acetyltransferase)
MYQVLMPRLGITMEEGRVARWLKAEGEHVAQGDVLFELESEKVLLEVEAQVSGVLNKILVAESETVAINTPVALIAVDGESAQAETAAEPAPPAQGEPEQQPAAKQLDPVVQALIAQKGWVADPSDRAVVSPFLRRLATELSLDLEALYHEDRSRPITEDLLRARAAEASTPSEKPAPQVDAPKPRVVEPAAAGDLVALSGVQRAMAANIARAWSEIPHFTQIVSVDMTKILASKPHWGEAKLNDVLLWLLAQEAVLHPWVNGRLEGSNVRLNKHADLSFAVATPDGLTVPVIRKAEELSLKELAAQTAQLIAKARDNRLSPADLQGGSITFSNLGAAGIETGTPIINAPQSTLVFAGAIIKKLVVGEDDAIRIAPTMKLSVSFDHRFIDGSRAAAFTTGFKKRIEESWLVSS